MLAVCSPPPHRMAPSLAPAGKRPQWQSLPAGWPARQGPAEAAWTWIASDSSSDRSQKCTSHVTPRAGSCATISIHHRCPSIQRAERHSGQRNQQHTPSEKRVAVPAGHFSPYLLPKELNRQARIAALDQARWQVAHWGRQRCASHKMCQQPARSDEERFPVLVPPIPSSDNCEHDPEVRSSDGA